MGPTGHKKARTDSGGKVPATPLHKSLKDSYDDYPRIEEAFQQLLDNSLNPRGPDSLFDLVGALELPTNGVAVDVGCGEGRDAIELARRFGLRVHGVPRGSATVSGSG